MPTFGLVVVLCISQALGGWIDPESMMPTTPSNIATYKATMGDLITAVKLSYTSTKGGYFNPTEANATVDGWDRALVRDPAVGMRALAFTQESTRRVIVAIRGTDLTECASGVADQCADQMLWDGTPYKNLPERCHNFSKSTLDYFPAAFEFAKNVSVLFPEYEILYTGHSLGAGISAMLATAGQAAGCGPKSAGAVVISSPAYVQPLLERVPVNMSVVNLSKVLIFADAFDPIFYSAQHGKLGGLASNVCLFHDGNESAVCEKCEQGGEYKRVHIAVSCALCMMERHVLKHYIEMWDSEVIPTCWRRPRNECLSQRCSASSSECPVS